MENTNGVPKNGKSDEELWLLSQKGDTAALGQLVGRYYSIAVGLCRGYRAVGMEQEDLLQEAFVGLLKAVRSFNPSKEVPFSGFAFLCMKRQLVSAVRRQNAKKHQPLNESVPFEDLTEFYIPGVSQSAGPETTVILEEESRWMREQVITLLSPLEKETLKLYLKGFRYDEMAKKLKCPEKSVDNALQRIRRKLRSAMNRGNQ